MMLPMWLAACLTEPAPPVPVLTAEADAVPAAAIAPADGALPAAGALHADGAFPATGAPPAPWTEAWTVIVVSETPEADGPRALAAGLGTMPSTWETARQPEPGVVFVVWVPTGSDVTPLAAHRTNGADLVAVLAGGDAPWAARTAARLHVAATAVVDSAASASLWVDSAHLDGSLAGAVAARVVADRYGVAFFPSTPLVGAFPPGLVVTLGPHADAFLTAEDVRTRAEAARNGGADALARDAEVAVRIGVALSTTDPAVLALLTTDPDPLVRARVAARSTDVTALAALSADPSSVVRIIATDRLVVTADNPGHTGAAALVRAAGAADGAQRWKAAAGLVDVSLLAALVNDRDGHVRVAAAARLGELGGKGIVEPLVAALRDPDSRLRAVAAAALAGAEDPRAVAALTASLQDPTRGVSDAAARALARRPATAGGAATPPKKLTSERDLELGVTSPDADVRAQTAAFLVGRADDPALAWFDQLSRDSDPCVRLASVLAMPSDPLITSRLQTALRDADPHVVLAALGSLARGKRGTAEVLAPLTSHADSEIRLRAVEALALLGRSEGLRSALIDTDERIRAAAVGAFPGDLAADEPSVLVRRAAAHGRTLPGADALLADAGDLGFWARGTLAREDEFLRTILGRPAAANAPTAPTTLRPPVILAYGRSDHG